MLCAGTEPKLKYYLEVAGEDRTVRALAGRLQAAVADELIDLAKFGLKRPDVA